MLTSRRLSDHHQDHSYRGPGSAPMPGPAEPRTAPHLLSASCGLRVFPHAHSTHARTLTCTFTRTHTCAHTLTHSHTLTPGPESMPHHTKNSQKKQNSVYNKILRPKIQTKSSIQLGLLSNVIGQTSPQQDIQKHSVILSPEGPTALPRQGLVSPGPPAAAHLEVGQGVRLGPQRLSVLIGFCPLNGFVGRKL